MIEEGQILDNTYRLVRLVAEGGMGLVYEATHARLAGRYAIKVLPQRWSKDPDAMARFDREARITSSLQHPNIVQIIDFNTAADGTEYLVMEYLRGETLAARLARVGPLPLQTVVPIVQQIAAGLAAAHAHGIVHRDLKPENVLLAQVEGREGDWAKILDFGISKAADARLGTIGSVKNTLIGTPQYMAPEQCEGRTKDLGPATDQFALAVITYEMLTGRPPFAGESIGDVLFRVLHAQPLPMNINDRVESVVQRGLAKSSSHRFPSVTAYAEALRAAALVPGQAPEGERGVEDSGSQPYAVGEIDRMMGATPSRRRHRAPVLLAAAVVTVATAFVVRAAGTRGPREAGLVTAAPSSATRSVPPALVVPTTSTRPPETTPPVVSENATNGTVDNPELSLRDSAEELAGAATPSEDELGRAQAAPPVEPTPSMPVSRTAPPRRGTAKSGALASLSATRTTAVRPGTARAPARLPTIRGRTPTAVPTLAQPVSVSQPPPFRPLPSDPDAILPLDEDYNKTP